jgi:hypothetical protein
MTAEVDMKGKYKSYSDEEIDALLKYFQCNGLELKPFLDKFEQE